MEIALNPISFFRKENPTTNQYKSLISEYKHFLKRRLNTDKVYIVTANNILTVTKCDLEGTLHVHNPTHPGRYSLSEAQKICKKKVYYDDDFVELKAIHYQKWYKQKILEFKSIINLFK